MKTRVAIVLPYFGKGGAESMVSRLVAHLDLDEVEPLVICVYGEQQHNKFEEAVLKHGVKITYIGKGKGFSLSAIIKLWNVLSKFSPQVIHTHLSACVYCAPWAVCHNVMMLHTVHSMPSHELIKPKQVIMKMMYATGHSVPVAISKEIKNLIPDIYSSKLGIELIYNPVDLESFSVKRVPHSNYVVVTVGRLSKEKNHKLLIEAFEKAFFTEDNVRLVIVGGGDLYSELKVLIGNSKIGTRIDLVGNVDNVQDYLAVSDLFVLSSTFEGLPLAILEAMAAGLPVVATNVGGVKDVVTDNGILVESENAQLLANAMRTMYESPTLAAEMSYKSISNVRRFDSNVIGEEYVKLYRKYAK